MNMRLSQRKLFTLVVLMMTASLWAETDTEELLTTIDSKVYKDYKSGSFTTTDGKAVVTFSNFVSNMNNDWGWYFAGSREMTITAGEGYTITMCRIYTVETPSGYDMTTLPFKVYLNGNRCYTGPNGTGTALGQYGVNKIEVFGGETVEVTEEAVNEYSFEMPAGDAKVFFEYYPIATISTAPTAVEGLFADDDKDIVTEGTTDEGTMMYARTEVAEAPALDAFSETLPTAQGLEEECTVYVWYYIKSDNVHSDSEIFGPIEVALDDPLAIHDLTFSPANIHKIEDGKAVVKIDRRYRTDDISEGMIQAVKVDQTIYVTPNVGYKLTSNTNLTLAENGTGSVVMPNEDFTINYELVRDMTYRTSAVMKDSRIRIQKTPETPFEYVDPTAILPIVKDTISATPLDMTLNTDYEYTLQEPDGEGWSDTETLSVGTFRLKITGKGLYVGETYTLPFELYQGYEQKVPAHSYITYYKDEALYVEDNDVKLYTITEVDHETATATELTVVPAYTPMLVFNGADTLKTVLLIPTYEDADDVEPAEEFKGTLEDKEMGASTDETDYYVLHRNAFVKVYTPGEISAHRCWLEIGNNQQSARILNIVHAGETTKIDRAERGEADVEAWYDLNGRKLNATPTRKGVYVLRPANGSLQGTNGRKVVVK